MTFEATPAGSDAYGAPVDASTGKTYWLDTALSEQHMASGTSGDDTFYASTDGRTENQIHLYGGAGNDSFYLDLEVAGLRHIQHGHHVFGGDGSDRLVLTNMADLRGTIVGRLDDFDNRTDEIWIGDQRLDLHKPQLFKDFDVQVVSYQGQQWLEIRNHDSGRALYALEGARRDIASEEKSEEPHFLEWDHPLPDTLPAVSYHDTMNALDPNLIQQYHPDYVLSPTGSVEAAHNIAGTTNSDLIATSRGDDLIDGGDGDDLLRSYLGDDTVAGALVTT